MEFHRKNTGNRESNSMVHKTNIGRISEFKMKPHGFVTNSKFDFLAYSNIANFAPHYFEMDQYNRRDLEPRNEAVFPMINEKRPHSKQIHPAPAPGVIHATINGVMGSQLVNKKQKKPSNGGRKISEHNF